MPIKRFKDFLKSNGQYNDYIKLLINSHNSNNLDGLMCKTQLSIDWLGRLYDCDFNQQLCLETNLEAKTLKELVQNEQEFVGRPIKVAEHCYGCSAGAGSSCGGALES